MSSKKLLMYTVHISSLTNVNNVLLIIEFSRTLIPGIPFFSSASNEGRDPSEGLTTCK